MASVLQITPHDVFPPRGGRRAFFFLREMARQHQVSAILPHTRESLGGTRDGYTFPVNVELLSPLETPPPGTIFNWLPSRIGRALQYRWLRRSWRGPANSTLLDMWHLIAAALQKKRLDLVIFDHIHSMCACASFVRRLSPQTVLALNAHNVDTDLYAQQLKASGEENDRALLASAFQTARYLETHLADYVQAFWACSEVDLKKLEEMNSGAIRGFAVSNGIAVELLPFDPNPDKQSLRQLIFCGAMYTGPNRHGLKWFHQAIWPLIQAQRPELRLRVVGGGARPTEFQAVRQDPSVDFIGEVDDVVPHYRQTSISIVPLLEGSGTRVKILEAMSLGNPVVSTRIGAEGIEAEQGREILLADKPDEFAAEVLRVLADHDLFENLRRAGRHLVEQKYDWRVIGREINQQVEQLVGSRETLPVNRSCFS
jgi:glycosyltransferase involved in cell wall biosynthesis